MKCRCSVTGREFQVSEHELALRKKLGVEGEPELHPTFRFQLLGAFWQHWNLHKRTCGKSGKHIISVFGEECPYPVWHKDEWLQHADPPGADFVEGKPVFEQMWEIFHRSPIAHNVGAGNENCEYTDDWWYSKNCYLCHSGVECEDLRYCYRTLRLRNCQFCVYCLDSERSIDLINCIGCHTVRYAFNSWQCSDSAFLYDCRNCQNCYLCSNLRNKQYCIRNEQYTKEEYVRAMQSEDFHSRKTYDKAMAEFDAMLRTRAWHRALSIDRSENVSGNYLDECKNSESCYFLTGGMQDAANVFRGGDGNKDCVDVVSPYGGAELVYNTCMPQDHCYDIKCCCDLIQCKSLEYCAHCFQCQHCFGCCGLVGKKYHIFNKPYEPKEYEALKTRIVHAMKKAGEYGRFFPGFFAPTPYEESIAGFYWPLAKVEGQRLGFRMRERKEARVADAADPSAIPDRSDQGGEELMTRAFWDDHAERPFQILPPDVAFSRDLGAPLPNTYYMRRLMENFRRISCDGETHPVQCARCGTATQTSWPKEYYLRVLCEECYLREVY
ncbi:MAG: hypothetical protein Q7R81_04890 [Candidatus Peregrinibacteria bacterium]|nr:hypothetical protein [Candidatus Peregrinibacteria bacterium]